MFNNDAAWIVQTVVELIDHENPSQLMKRTKDFLYFKIFDHSLEKLGFELCQMLDSQLSHTSTSIFQYLSSDLKVRVENCISE